VKRDGLGNVWVIVLGDDGNFWRLLEYEDGMNHWRSLGSPTGRADDIQESFIFRREVNGTLEVVVRDSDNQFWRMQQMLPWSLKCSAWQTMPENPVPGSEFFDMDVYGDDIIAHAFIATSDGVFVSQQLFYEDSMTPPSGYPKPYLFYYSDWIPLGSPPNKWVVRFSAGKGSQLGIYSWAPSLPGDMETWRFYFLY
jgi:hypothetical protein